MQGGTGRLSVAKLLLFSELYKKQSDFFTFPFPLSPVCCAIVPN